jgi:uncharacterized protein
MSFIGGDRLVRHHPENGDRRGFRWASGSTLLIAAALLGALTVVLVTSQASAQFFFDNRYSNERARPNRAVQQQSQWFWSWQPWQQPQQPQQPVVRRTPRPPPPPTDFSKAPPPRKQDTRSTSRVLVMGDAMADWLAYGLEEVLSETPEIGVIRKVHTFSGLLPSESHDAYDWPVLAREVLAAETPDFVVIMIGLADRRTIRERQIRSARQRVMQEGPQTPQPGQTPVRNEQVPGAPQDDKAASDATSYEFRSEKWGEFYSRRIDDTIAALKSKGVPVAWVGLPAIRGTKATADIAYLDDLYRRHAEKAGIIYVDLWDGFVDESGNFAPEGPDVEGQTRRLRTNDGVYFTKAGARKLGHYVEREFARLTSARATPVVLPPAEAAQTPATGEPQPQQVPARPLAGPVVPLTEMQSDSGELLGGGASKSSSPSPLATRVLVKGEPIAAPTGRADDFGWPRREGLPRPGAAEASLDSPSPTVPPVASPKNSDSKDSAAASPAAPRAHAKHVRKRATPRFVDRTPWQFGANGISGFQPFGWSQQVSAARPWVRRSQP